VSDHREWHEMARHLIQAHGGDADALVGYTPTLEQLRFVHTDTHAALTIIGARPPDRHTHQAPTDSGWYEARPSSYRPFPPSPSASDDLFFTLKRHYPNPSYTGLPHTGSWPSDTSDLADWAALAGAAATGELRSERDDWIQRHAAAATRRWLTRADFPSSAAAARPARAAASHPPRQQHGAGRPQRRGSRTSRGRR
jgi:hypothetical protein